MKIFYDAGLQHPNKRASFHKAVLDTLEQEGHYNISRHTQGRTIQEISRYLNNTFGALPTGPERHLLLKKRLVETIEGSIDGVIFDLTIPSPSIMVGLTHAYQRPRLHLPAIPILCLQPAGQRIGVLEAIDMENANLSVLPYTNSQDVRYKIIENIKEWN